MKISGTVVEVLPIVTVGANGTSKGGFVISFAEGTKTRNVFFNTWAKFAEDLILKTGSLVEVEFDVESRSYNNKWYTDATARAVANVSGNATSKPEAKVAASAAANDSFRVADTKTNPEDSDLPF